MKKIAFILVLMMITLQGGCQEDKIFREVVTFEKGFKFSPTGTVQTIPFTGTSSTVTWETLTGKPSVFPPATHVHSYPDLTNKPTLFSGSYTDLTNKPSEVELQAAIQSMNVILIPKLTTAQINALAPSAGSLVFDTSLGVLKMGSGTSWKILITGN
jgi:hypothetical protein